MSLYYQMSLEIMHIVGHHNACLNMNLGHHDASCNGNTIEYMLLLLIYKLYSFRGIR